MKKNLTDIDMTNICVGKLLVIGPFQLKERLDGIGHYKFWRCLCDCGNIKFVRDANLRSKNTQSCGCNVFKTHGLSKTRAYSSWKEMKKRCYVKSSEFYKNYGGRGFTVCDHWLNSFANFFADMGERPIGHSIERINNNLGYMPSNCKWADSFEQANNTRKIIRFEYQGFNLTTSQWEKKLEYPKGTILRRIKFGWSVERILTEKINLRIKSNHGKEGEWK